MVQSILSTLLYLKHPAVGSISDRAAQCDSSQISFRVRGSYPSASATLPLLRYVLLLVPQPRTSPHGGAVMVRGTRQRMFGQSKHAKVKGYFTLCGTS